MKRQRKQLIKPVPTMVLCTVMMVINIYGISSALFEKEPHSDFSMIVHAEDIPIEQQRFLAEELDSVPDTSAKVLSNVEAMPVEEEEEVQECVVIEPIEFKNQNGKYVTTQSVIIDMQALKSVYYSELEKPVWDKKDRINVLAVLWHFLVEQQEVPPENAAGILGNIYAEGTFGLKEGGDGTLSNIEQVRSTLGDGNECGYGLAQWTDDHRQSTLLKFYEMAYAECPDDWELCSVVAESAMLVEEIKGYGVFENLYVPTSIEDATGRVACVYEKYDTFSSDWNNINGTYVIECSSSSGQDRLTMATNIYNYFMR